MAPEVFELDDSGMYDWRCDVFSYAMLMYETILRKMPYADQFPDFDADPRIAIHVALGLRPDVVEEATMPRAMGMLIQQAWSAQPEERPTFVCLEQSLKEQYTSLGGTIY
jgi:serine/threonine protein kinase